MRWLPLVALCLFCCSYGYRLTQEKAEIIQIEGALGDSLSDDLKRSEVSKRACPNDCSGHGTCSNSACSCYVNWRGSDCSIQEIPLTSGVAMTGSVQSFRWNYYYLTLRYAGNVQVVLNQTGSTGDCDLYAQVNDIPTRNSYYRRDISTRAVAIMQLNNVQAGTWYFGVYGFLACNFSITATSQGTCPNSCSGHGTCLNGNCICQSPYYGDDCSTRVTTIVAGTPVTGSVGNLQWNYYSINFQNTPQRDVMVITLTQTTTGDADIYVKFQNIPTEYSYDYSNITLRDTSTISITEPQSGVWVIGIHGFRACNYTLSVSTGGVCPNLCSGPTHGTCGGVTCSCNTGYTGDYCNTKTDPLPSGGSDSGYVSSGTWNYYSYNVNSVDNLLISIVQTSTTGDCDLYAKSGSKPTRVNYDASDVGTTQNFTLTISDPGNALWWIGIYGWSTCQYTISITESNACPAGCTVHGTCGDDGSCLCNPGWSGPACDQTSNTLQKGVTLYGQTLSGGFNAWNYYTYVVNNASTMHISLRETNSDGWLWIYVNTERPTLRNYLYSDTETNTNIHRVTMILPQPGPSTFQIGIYGNPYALSDRTITYDLVAWSPDF